MGRHARGLSAAARADRDVSWLLLRPAARAFRLDAAGVGCRKRRESPHHWALHHRRHALHHQVSLGAAGRRTRRAGALPHARTAARLARLLADPPDDRDRAARAVRSEARTRPPHRGGADGCDGVGHAGHRDRRVPRRKPARERAGRRHGVVCGGLSRGEPALDRRRALHRDRLRDGPRLSPQCGLDGGIPRDGAVRADRVCGRDPRHRAREIRRRRCRACPPCRREPHRPGDRNRARGALPTFSCATWRW